MTCDLYTLDLRTKPFGIYQQVAAMTERHLPGTFTDAKLQTDRYLGE